MTALQTSRLAANTHGVTDALPDMLSDVSIEVTPRTLAKAVDFADRVTAGTRVFIARIEGTPFSDILQAARSLAQAGATPVPHIPARMIQDRPALVAELEQLQGEAGVTQALLLGGGGNRPVGDYDSSIKLLETDLFHEMGFCHLSVAGHPEGNKDIDPTGQGDILLDALRWKQEYANKSGIHMSIVTQFAFDSDPIISWAAKLRNEGITLPVHVGLSGPAKLPTLIKYGISCGVGASVKVLQRRAKDITRLARAFEPTDIAQSLAVASQNSPELGLQTLHLFPLGGIGASLDWLKQHQTIIAKGP